ncbi:MAG TPA: GNAT family N-acetyltransferase [Pyrinomonadaceae bacterium]
MPVLHDRPVGMQDEKQSVRFNIRPAAPGEAASLTELAVRSKSHWGYDAEFIDDSRADLTVTPNAIDAGRVFVAESAGVVAGFYSLSGEGEEAEVELLFVEPRQIGTGAGRALWRHAAATARRLGFRTLVVASDPFAEPFYRAMGAERVGERESIVRAGRMLPLLRYPLD